MMPDFAVFDLRSARFFVFAYGNENTCDCSGRRNSVRFVVTSRTQLANLKSARASGVGEIWIGERRVQYRSDREMVAAIAALENEIAKSEETVTRTIVVHSNKGWQS
jgi:hypothetical protein